MRLSQIRIAFDHQGKPAVTISIDETYPREFQMKEQLKIPVTFNADLLTNVETQAENLYHALLKR
jgi:hypothetical protein